ncbi:MAG: hypothetical protein PHS14_17965 [Elusimicrobia bacterium]|nr:hypothetical protein [Elusimicrobiota bacterium]
MKLRAKTSASVSLQLGPLIEPGRDVDFGEGAEVPEGLRAEIEENVKKGLIEIVHASPVTPLAPAAETKETPKKKSGR